MFDPTTLESFTGGLIYEGTFVVCHEAHTLESRGREPVAAIEETGTDARDGSDVKGSAMTIREVLGRERRRNGRVRRRAGAVLERVSHPDASLVHRARRQRRSRPSGTPPR
ncbi:MAG: hypothetical protein ACQET5_04765 [Halobacteriota archaeon]|uniref:hypothetical protein n=1 Tax=Natronomonas sp. TaxID=2184060 RepID=UPI003975FF64